MQAVPGTWYVLAPYRMGVVSELVHDPVRAVRSPLQAQHCCLLKSLLVSWALRKACGGEEAEWNPDGGHAKVMPSCITADRRITGSKAPKQTCSLNPSSLPVLRGQGFY